MGLVSQYGNYPNSYREFVNMFPDNAACEAFLFKLRWPVGGYDWGLEPDAD